LSDEFPDQSVRQETPEQRAAERETLRQYGLAREFAAVRQAAPLAPYDGVMFNKSGIAAEIVEVKNHTSPMDKYPTLKIDKKKIDDIVAYGKKHNIRAVLVVNWAGDIRWLNLTEIEAENGGEDSPEPLFPEATIKRRDRLEEVDRVYCIDTLLFRTLAIQPYQGLTHAV
jgi:hypothetical protein